MSKMWNKFNTLTNQFSKITEITKDLLKDDREGEEDEIEGEYEDDYVEDENAKYDPSNPPLRRVSGDGSTPENNNAKQNKTLFLTQLVQTQKDQLSSLKSESAKLRKQVQDKDRQLEHVIQELSELRNIREHEQRSINSHTVNGTAPARESHDAASNEHVNTALIDEMYRTYCDGNEAVKDVNLKIAAVARQLASAVKLGQKAAHKDKDERQWREMTRDLTEQLTASQHECQSVKSQLEILQRQLVQYDHVIKSPVSITDLQLERDTLTRANAALRAELEQHVQSLAVTRRELAQLNEEIEMVHEQRARDKTNHQLEIEALQHELDRAASQHQSVKQFALDQARDSEEEIERLAALVEDLQRQHAHLQHQLHDRVHLEEQMRLREDETTRVREELANLRHVLDAINGEFAVDLEAKTALLKKENVQLTQQRDEALTALEEANSKLSQVSTDSDKSLFLEQQLHAKDQEIEKLRAEIGPLRRILEEAITRLKLSEQEKNKDAFIDKQVVTRLIVTYISDKTKRADVLELMAKILHFSDEDKKHVGLIHTRSWSIFSPFSSPAKNTVPAPSLPEGKSLTDLWVEFLLADAAAEKKGDTAPPQ